MFLRTMVLLVTLLSSVYADGFWTDLGEVPIYGTPIRLEQTARGYSIDFIPYEWEGGALDAVIIDPVTGISSISESCSEPSEPVVFFPVPMTANSCMDMSIPEGIVRIDPGGDTLWTCVLDTVSGYEKRPMWICPSDSGGCRVIFSPEPGQYIFEVVRVSGEGEVLSRAEFQLQGGPLISMHALAETTDGGLVMTGVTDSLGMNLYLVVIRLDSEGVETWRVLEPFLFHANGDIVRVNPEGCIVIAGYTGLEREDGWFMPPQDTDLLLLKLDPAGREIWRSVLDRKSVV